MSISLLCKNYECPYNKKLEEPVSFSFSAIYTPFEGDKCNGKCSTPNFELVAFDYLEGDFRREGAACGMTALKSADFTCSKVDCSHNEKAMCTRSEILIDKENGKWVCKCFAFRKIRGHTDWFSLLNADGTAKGGNIDDNYAEKINRHAKTTRSYRTHMKQASS
jgi:hypothetical protein